MKDVRLRPEWKALLGREFEKPYMQNLAGFLRAEKAAGKTIYPPGPEIFRALDLVAPDQVKVTIIGQDPYHGPSQAHGLSFSVKPGITPPPSLVNIYKELKADLGIEPVRHGFLEHWARQGVLLLNNSLTVEARQAGSHRDKGWEPFTDAVIRAVNDGPPAVFMLWGKPAREKAASVDSTRHLVLATSHPSPMGGACNMGFFGSRPFSKANAFLEKNGRDAIDWALPANPTH